MTTQSCKAKGRKLQQTVRDAFLSVGKAFGLVTGDVVSTSMGASGVDVILSPAAKKVFGNVAIECKNVEALNVAGVFFEHAAKYPDWLPILVHKRNKTEPLVTLRLTDYMKLLEKGLEYAF